MEPQEPRRSARIAERQSRAAAAQDPHLEEAMIALRPAFPRRARIQGPPPPQDVLPVPQDLPSLSDVGSLSTIFTPRADLHVGLLSSLPLPPLGDLFEGDVEVDGQYFLEDLFEEDD